MTYQGTVELIFGISSHSILKLDPDFLVSSSLTTQTLRVGVKKTRDSEFFGADLLNRCVGACSVSNSTVSCRNITPKKLSHIRDSYQSF